MHSQSQPLQIMRQLQFQSITLNSGKLDSLNDASSRESSQIKSSSENDLKLKQSQFFQDSDSEDSCVSLEANQMLQHNSCAEEKVQKLFNFLFLNSHFSWSLQTNNFQGLQNQYSLIQYIKSGESLISKDDLPIFLAFLKTHSKLKEFLDNLFDKVSPLLLPQLILISQRISVIYSSIKYQSLNMNQLWSLASNQLFLKTIFANNSFKFLNYYNSVSNFYWCEVIMNTLISQFMVFFSFTVLLVLEGYFINPYFTQINIEQPTVQEFNVQNKENTHNLENESNGYSYFYPKQQKIKQTRHCQ